MVEREPCYLVHEVTAAPRARYETTINRPGQEPERIVCCRDCAQAVYDRDVETLRKQKGAPDRTERLIEAINDPKIEIPKPERIREPPQPERSSIGLDPPGYRSL